MVADYDDRGSLPGCPCCGCAIDPRADMLSRCLESVEIRYLNALEAGIDDPIVAVAAEIPGRPDGASVLVFDRSTFARDFLGRSAESRLAGETLLDAPEGRMLSVVVLDDSGLCVYHRATPA